MAKERICPACGKILGNDMHRAKPFDVAPGTQLTIARFWICDDSIKGLEDMVKAYREARFDQFVNIP